MSFFYWFVNLTTHIQFLEYSSCTDICYDIFYRGGINKLACMVLRSYTTGTNRPHQMVKEVFIKSYIISLKPWRIRLIDLTGSWSVKELSRFASEQPRWETQGVEVLTTLTSSDTVFTHWTDTYWSIRLFFLFVFWWWWFEGSVAQCLTSLPWLCPIHPRKGSNTYLHLPCLTSQKY